MINRRHIRIKVMQSVYAYFQSENDNLRNEEKFIYSSIDKLFNLYLLQLSLLSEVVKYEKKYIKISKKKHLATSEELNPNTKFVDNKVINLIAESVSLKAYIKQKKLNNWELNDEYLKDVWKLIKESKIYINYMKSKDNSFEDDKSFVIDIFKELIAPNDELAEYFEGENISWVDDIPFVNTWMVKTLNKINEKYPFRVGNLYKDEDDKQFVVDLFRKVILNIEKYENEIIDKTPNWDKERIAEIDKILIVMAIAEFLEFSTIPTKVTINEYIEISKDYSTDKSSYFINGVLDKVLKEFTASKRFEKIGRGLM